MREGSSEPGRGECFFVVEKTFRTRPSISSATTKKAAGAQSMIPAKMSFIPFSISTPRQATQRSLIHLKRRHGKPPTLSSCAWILWLA